MIVAAERLAETAGDGGLAVRAAAFGGQFVAADVVPVADDQRGVAARAGGGAVFAVVDVTGENIVQAGIERDATAWIRLAGGAGGTQCNEEFVRGSRFAADWETRVGGSLPRQDHLAAGIVVINPGP